MLVSRALPPAHTDGSTAGRAQPVGQLQYIRNAVAGPNTPLNSTCFIGSHCIGFRLSVIKGPATQPAQRCLADLAKNGCCNIAATSYIRPGAQGSRRGQG